MDLNIVFVLNCLWTHCASQILFF